MKKQPGNADSSRLHQVPGEPPTPYNLKRVVVTTTTILAGFLLLLVVYVLSCGSAEALRRHGYIRTSTFDAIYEPLWGLENTSFGNRCLRPALEWYVGLWV